jgi:hypothetical protein
MAKGAQQESIAREQAIYSWEQICYYIYIANTANEQSE